ncbi:hypothetical protein D3C72_1815060 [compost metagenome]
MLFHRADRYPETLRNGAISQPFVAMQDEDVQAAAGLGEQGGFQAPQDLMGRGNIEGVGGIRHGQGGGVVRGGRHFTCAAAVPVGGDVGGDPEYVRAVIVRAGAVVEFRQLDPGVLCAVLGHIARACAHRQKAQQFAVVAEKYVRKGRHVAGVRRQ